MKRRNRDLLLVAIATGLFLFMALWGVVLAFQGFQGALLLQEVSVELRREVSLKVILTCVASLAMLVSFFIFGKELERLWAERKKVVQIEA